MRPRILFVSETVTLAHASRPVVLASALDPERFDVRLAWHPRYAGLFGDAPFPTETIDVIPSSRFNDALRSGRPFLDIDTLRRYVAEDRRLIRARRPDLIVGDFRLSLTLSAALEGVPLAMIASPYWSPRAEFRPVMPEHLLGRVLPRWFCDRVLFPLALPWASESILAPFRRLRRELGLPPFVGGLRDLYTSADAVLWDGHPDLTPLSGDDPTRRFLGPIFWSPRSAAPSRDETPRGGPCAYVTLGTSGNGGLLDGVVRALSRQGWSAIVATAGAPLRGPWPTSVRSADYFPGAWACAHADVVVCNGGGTAVQALGQGTPVVGIPSNLDQVLGMQSVERAGAGVLVRATENAGVVAATVRAVWADGRFKHRAQALARAFRKDPAPDVFRRWMDERFSFATETRVLGGVS
jgi:UDP:flavonoid glycosyltransferase YjiC (YdhE family)